jgi:hypothetical protein
VKYVPRATTKVGLIKSANEQFDKMWTLVDSMTQQQQLAIFNFDGKSLGKEAHWEGIKHTGSFCSLI